MFGTYRTLDVNKMFVQGQINSKQLLSDNCSAWAKTKKVSHCIFTLRRPCLVLLSQRFYI